MGLEIKRIIVIVTVILLILCGIGIGLGIKKSPPTLELEVWPRDYNTEELLVQYRSSDRDSWSAWVNRTDEFLREYHVTPSGNVSQCSPGSVCEVDVDNYQPCTADNYYGYHRSSPCVFLRLTKILDWSPLPYNTTDNLPAEMPDYLKTHISAVAGTRDANMVWVSCEGVAPADKEFMGPLRLIPARGFSSSYFPFTDKKGYLSPLVAVYFERPQTGVLFNIECKAWAKNIEDQHDIARFWFLID